jgi:adenylosuccinate synthase
VGDLADPAHFRSQVERAVKHKNRLLGALLSSFEPLDARAVAEQYLDYGSRLSGFVRDTTAWLHDALARSKRLLFEGAQGSLLDVDHGTYPYVTSSNSSAAGIVPGSGVPARAIDRWLGVVKAYTTRVGGGPFPTELHDETGERIRRVGKEYGTVTGRPRRCGWFDAVAVRHAARVSGATDIAIMLLDVLSGLPRLHVAVAYEDERGNRIDEFPSSLGALEGYRPVLEELPGWSEDISGARSWDELPSSAREYILFLARQVGVPVSIVSVGPDRRATVLLS